MNTLFHIIYNKFVVTFSKLFISSNKTRLTSTDSDTENHLPPIIELGESNEFNIEVRGERIPNLCWFSSVDISRELAIKNIGKVITSKTRYIINKHYTYFKIKLDDEYVDILFLTYKGLVNLSYGCKNKKCMEIIDWTIDVLFTKQINTGFAIENTSESVITNIQMFTPIEHINVKNTCAILRSSVTPISCIYLIAIGKMKYIKQYLNCTYTNYTDDDIVYKYGRTINLERRLKEHSRIYGKITKSNIKLVYYGYVDDTNCVDAERHIRKYFDKLNYNLVNNKHKELVVIPSSQINDVGVYYKSIAIQYSNEIIKK